MTDTNVYLVPCIACGRERRVYVVDDGSIWQAWRRPCLWCLTGGDRHPLIRRVAS